MTPGHTISVREHLGPKMGALHNYWIRRFIRGSGPPGKVGDICSPLSRGTERELGQQERPVKNMKHGDFSNKTLDLVHFG